MTFRRPNLFPYSDDKIWLPWHDTIRRDQIYSPRMRPGVCTESHVNGYLYYWLKTLFLEICFLLRCDVLWSDSYRQSCWRNLLHLALLYKKTEESFTSKMSVNNHKISRSQMPYWNHICSHRVENFKSQTLALFFSFRRQAIEPGIGTIFLHWASQPPSESLESQCGWRNLSDNSWLTVTRTPFLQCLICCHPQLPNFYQIKLAWYIKETVLWYSMV